MNDHEHVDEPDVATDLGAVTEVTLGVWDPHAMENHLIPQARDF